MRRLTASATLALVLSACSGASEPEVAERPTGGGAESSVAPTATSDADPQPTTSSSTPEEPPHPVSLPALMEREYDGGDLRLGREVLRTDRHVQREVTYRAGDLTISGVIAVPHGEGPFPALVLAHGYIDPAIYTTGRGMTRERAWFGDQGFVTLHVDYRNHASSDDDPQADVRLRTGYTEDVIGAVLALRDWRGPVDDERIAVGGRSMGGGVVYNVLAAQPGLVDAGVVWAPVSSLAAQNFERWIRPDSGRSELAARIIRRYGDPRSERPAVRRFWRQASPRPYFDELTEPVMVHHGTLDDTCPIRWSNATVRAMRRAGVDVSYEVYRGEGHAFGPQFFESMERTTQFLRRHLR
jgi:dipeptidyl aminopeptidase/acylaminoacyl peptidase